MTAAIEAIDFCLVVRIFLPASTQLHEHEFPGTDPNDCLVKQADGSWFPYDLAKKVRCAKHGFGQCLFFILVAFIAHAACAPWLWLRGDVVCQL